MFRLCALALFSLSTLQLFSAEPFVVHEWGVYVRSQAVVQYSVGHKGGRMKSQTSDLLSCPQELISGLPLFVKRHAGTFTPRHEEREWAKPVIHFYGPEGLAVTVQIKTPQGQPLAYWPAPEFTEEMIWCMGSGESTVTGLTWKGKLSAQLPANVQVQPIPDGHWWNALRKVPGMWLKTESGTERFIFYEANAVQAPSVVSSVTGDTLKISNTASEESGRVLVLVNDGASRHFMVLESVPRNGTREIARAEIMKTASDENALLKAAREQWESFGMTPEEAVAIVEAWKPDLLGHIGVMVLAKMPGSLYEKMFPITVTPQPEKIVRAGVVFDQLPREEGRLAWLPGLESVMNEWMKDLSKEDFEVRNASKSKFARLGDLAQPFLVKLEKSEDAEVRAATSELLGALKPAELNILHWKPNPAANPNLSPSNSPAVGG